MKQLQVALSSVREDFSYPIIIGTKLLASLQTHLPFDQYSKVVALVDENIAKTLSPLLAQSLPAHAIIEPVTATEDSKCVSYLEKLWTFFNRAKLDRHSLVLNVGGGALGDLGGFAASTYMRGIDFIQVPTTLLSQVDASIGGKVAINLGGIKNLIGSFQQPVAVVIDLDTLRSLPPRELHAGFAEILKHGLIRDIELFDQLSKLGLAGVRSEEKLEQIIFRSCEIKGLVVAEDPYEQGVRKTLNFGHTIGHALESISHQGSRPLLHGEAVSIGMVAEAELSRRCGLIADEDVTRIEQALTRFELPIRTVEPVDCNAVLERLSRDKKNKGGEVRWTLLEKPGQAIYDCTAPLDAVELSIRHVTNG